MTVDYSDGAESEVLAALRSAADTSAGSDELATLVSGWEMGYHFAPQRLGLLAPLAFGSGSRIADLGCGSGVLTRAFGESGADVLGIEGVPDRAAAAARRCHDLDRVEIVAGRTERELAGRDPFDLVLLCGLLEHTAAEPDGPGNVLDAAVRAVAEDGVLVLAIENQLGLGYLAGTPEDHHSTSWVGLADYPGHRRSPRTWTSRQLAAMLAERGLDAQRWLVPYPDYKLPRVVLDGSVFDRPDAAELVDKLVRDPLHGTFGGNDAVVSGRVFQRLLLEEGLGLNTAPSFLVVAGRSDAALAAHTHPGLAWMVTNGRRRRFRRSRVVTPELTLRTLGGAEDAGDGWLRQHHMDTEPIVPGRPLDADLLEALHSGDEAEIGRLLRVWHAVCLRDARRLAGDDVRHPYLPGLADVSVLPADRLDVHPGNVILRPDGQAEQVDREWRAGTGVDAELVVLRALLEFAREVVVDHAAHPWLDDNSVGGVLSRLCAFLDLEHVCRSRWPELVRAEASLQEMVTGQPADRTAEAIAGEADRVFPAPLWDRVGGVRSLLDHESELARAVEHQRAEFERLLHRAQVEMQRERDQDGVAARALLETELRRVREEHRAESEARDHELALARAELARLDDRIGLAMADLADAVHEAASAHRHAEELRAALEQRTDQLARSRAAEEAARADVTRVEGSRLVRAGHRLLWPAGRVVRGARDLALGRPGEEPDGLLRALSRRAPALVPLVGRRVRRAEGLRFALDLPDQPLRVGQGQVLEVAGWVVHERLPVREAWLVVDGREHAVSLGHPRQDVVDALRPLGVRVPLGCGLRARVPVPAIPADRTLSLAVRVRLTDGTVLQESAEDIALAADAGLAPTAVSWPADGPRVAICLATYEPDARFLERQLESLRTQTHRNWVCLISDDGSSVDGRAVIRKMVGDDERFVVVEHERNVGFYRNFERALAALPIDADAVALCDQDDVWDPEKLEILLGALREPGVQLAYCDMRLIDDDETVLAESFWGRRRNQCDDLLALLQLNTVTGAACLARAEFVRTRALPFPPGTPSAFHDHWLAVAALAAGHVSFVDRAVQSYRQHGANVSGRREDDLDEGLPTLPRRRRSSAVLEDLSEEQRRRLDAVAEFELPRLAQFAAVLVLRDDGRLDAATRARLEQLSWADRRIEPLVDLTELPSSTRSDTAGAERLFLLAGLWRQRMAAERRVLPRERPRT